MNNQSAVRLPIARTIILFLGVILASHAASGAKKMQGHIWSFIVDKQRHWIPAFACMTD